jgi:hypothetical protein
MPTTNTRNISFIPHSGVSGYYPFGMQMQGREFAGGMGYRYGLQNWERDDVIAGRGNSYTTLYRQHDPRLSRTWSQDPKSQFNSRYIMLGNSPTNGLDPDGAWFWEKSHIRQARAFSKQTGGDFNSWKEKDGSRHAGVVIMTIDKYYDEINNYEIGDMWRFTSYNFKPDKDYSNRLRNAGVGFYETQRATAKGVKRFSAAISSADAWVHGWNEYERNGQAPTSIKFILGFNPILSTANAISVISTDVDIYRVDASSGTDHVLAWSALVAPLNPGRNLLGKVLPNGGKMDLANTIIQHANDAGFLDALKNKKIDGIDK